MYYSSSDGFFKEFISCIFEHTFIWDKRKHRLDIRCAGMCNIRIILRVRTPTFVLKPQILSSLREDNLHCVWHANISCALLRCIARSHLNFLTEIRWIVLVIDLTKNEPQFVLQSRVWHSTPARLWHKYMYLLRLYVWM